MRTIPSVAILLSLVAVVRLAAQDCPSRAGYYRTTDHYSFIASSGEGAVGDVVPVDISVLVETPIEGLNLFALTVVGCYDEAALELLEEAQYTPDFDRLSYSSTFRHDEVHAADSSPPGTRGFVQVVALRKALTKEVFPAPEPLHLMTVFFRVKGSPGTATEVRFCDDEVRTRTTEACNRNTLLYNGATAEEQLYAHSTRHAAGTIRILEGPATRPEPPPVPAYAKVYPEAPSAESAGITFEITASVAPPGAVEVPLGLYVTSSYEWSGFAASVTFPVEYLELARVEEHTRPGVVRIDNSEGFLGMYMNNSRRRVGGEGERVRVATLFFNVKEAASEQGQVSLSFEDKAGYLNWLAISYEDNVTAEALPHTSEVGPLILAHGLLAPQTEPVVPGDVTADDSLDMTDALVVLDWLFLGEDRRLCPEASDYNADGAVNLSDVIALLNHLFVGGPPAELREILCNT